MVHNCVGGHYGMFFIAVHVVKLRTRVIIAIVYFKKCIGMRVIVLS